MHEHHGEHDGNRVREQVLDRVRVLRCKGHGRRELMMLLVDLGVDPRMVQGAMRGVEEHFARNQRDQAVRRDLAEWREAGRGGEEGEAEVLEIQYGEVDGFRGDGPDEDVPDAFLDGGPGRLAPLALELVPVGESREGQIDGEIDGADQPESHQLAQDRGAELDQSWGVIVGDLGPEPSQVDIFHT